MHSNNNPFCIFGTEPMTDKRDTVICSNLYLFVLSFFEHLGSIYNGGNCFREVAGGHQLFFVFSCTFRAFTVNGKLHQILGCVMMSNPDNRSTGYGNSRTYQNVTCTLFHVANPFCSVSRAFFAAESINLIRFNWLTSLAPGS